MRTVDESSSQRESGRKVGWSEVWRCWNHTESTCLNNVREGKWGNRWGMRNIANNSEQLRHIVRMQQQKRSIITKRIREPKVKASLTPSGASYLSNRTVRLSSTLVLVGRFVSVVSFHFSISTYKLLVLYDWATSSVSLCVALFGGILAWRYTRKTEGRSRKWEHRKMNCRQLCTSHPLLGGRR